MERVRKQQIVNWLLDKKDVLCFSGIENKLNLPRNTLNEVSRLKKGWLSFENAEKIEKWILNLNTLEK